MTRVLLVDDHAVVRAGLASLLARMEGIDVVASLGTAEDALAQLPDLEPDLVILDHRLPGMDGITACERFLSVRPDVRVLVVTQFASVELKRRAFRAGATAFVVKAADEDTLQQAVRAVANGETFVDPLLTVPKALTERQVTVLRLIAQGQTTAKVARVMGISKRTVQTHVDRAKANLGVANRQAAVAEVVRRGLA